MLCIGWKGRGAGVYLIAASVTTVVWAAVMAYGFWLQNPTGAFFRVFEVIRSSAWLIFLSVVVALVVRRDGRPAVRRWSSVALLAFCVVVLASELLPLIRINPAILGGSTDSRLLGSLGLSIIGLALVENLYRNTHQDRRWEIKYLCLGIGAIFAYDFYLYSDSLLFDHISYQLLEARGAPNALVVPLLAISAARNSEWSIDVFVSRRAVFHSAAFMGSGIYLLVMAAAAFYLREFGGQWGTVLQVIALFGAAVLLLVVLFSGRFRAALRIFFSKHFFNYKYDYREEWLRFIRTLSSSGGDATLHIRVIQAVADIFDIPDGGLWACHEPDRLSLVAAWNFPQSSGIEPLDGKLARFLDERKMIINLEEYRESPDVYSGLDVPDWIDLIDRAWLIVPLLHHDCLTGFLILGRPRAARTLNWEDYDLLKTGGSQIASYLAEQQATRALTEARQFEAFNRRFAFVMHDIKNLVSQLSLMVKNASKHRDNPDFREDMIRTVEDSVDKMNRLLTKLSSDRTRKGPQPVVDLVPMLYKIVSDKSVSAKSLTFATEIDGATVAAEGDRIAAIIGHLVQNAIEAVENGGFVEVRLTQYHDEAIVEVEDSGPGMDVAFIRDELFRPFRSTKKGGYGIGVYDCREFAREHGGRLDVSSTPGRGTTMRLALPIVGSSQLETNRRHKAKFG